MAEVLKVTVGGYYSWLKRFSNNDSDKKPKISEFIRKVFLDSNCIYGSRKISKELKSKYGMTVNRKKVADIMRKEGIHSKSNKKYKATTNSKHHLPVYENKLNRDFVSAKPNMKMVSDITYIRTDEGWLYLAAVMDLCGRKIIGMAMGSRMTKQLTIDVLKDAVSRSGDVKGCILHSDMGSQYCSRDYQNLVHAYGFITSMSRKGNCWDNSPMECFWGKLKQEWLNDQHFKTRDEARKAVFEYIWIFYNRKRIHASNGYMTPEEYYSKCA